MVPGDKEVQLWGRSHEAHIGRNYLDLAYLNMHSDTKQKQRSYPGDNNMRRTFTSVIIFILLII